ncbi:hypothetical protein LW138_06975, partial [Helicobacter sp. faydin-H17]
TTIIKRPLNEDEKNQIIAPLKKENEELVKKNTELAIELKNALQTIQNLKNEIKSILEPNKSKRISPQRRAELEKQNGRGR